MPSTVQEIVTGKPDKQASARDPRALFAVTHLIQAGLLLSCILVTGRDNGVPLARDDDVKIGVYFVSGCKDSPCWNPQENVVKIYLGSTHAAALLLAVIAFYCSLVIKDALSRSKLYFLIEALLCFSSIALLSSLSFLFSKAGYSAVSVGVILSLLPAGFIILSAISIVLLCLTGRFKRRKQRTIPQKVEVAARRDFEVELFGLGFDGVDVVERAGLSSKTTVSSASRSGTTLPSSQLTYHAAHLVRPSSSLPRAASSSPPRKPKIDNLPNQVAARPVVEKHPKSPPEVQSRPRKEEHAVNTKAIAPANAHARPNIPQTKTDPELHVHVQNRSPPDEFLYKSKKHQSRTNYDEAYDAIENLGRAEGEQEQQVVYTQQKPEPPTPLRAGTYRRPNLTPIQKAAQEAPPRPARPQSLHLQQFKPTKQPLSQMRSDPNLKSRTETVESTRPLLAARHTSPAPFSSLHQPSSSVDSMKADFAVLDPAAVEKTPRPESLSSFTLDPMLLASHKPRESQADSISRFIDNAISEINNSDGLTGKNGEDQTRSDKSRDGDGTVRSKGKKPQGRHSSASSHSRASKRRKPRRNAKKRESIDDAARESIALLVMQNSADSDSKPESPGNPTAETQLAKNSVDSTNDRRLFAEHSDQ